MLINICLKPCNRLFISLCSSVAYHTIIKTIYKAEVYLVPVPITKQFTLYLNMGVNGELQTPGTLPKIVPGNNPFSRL